MVVGDSSLELRMWAFSRIDGLGSWEFGGGIWE